MSKKAWHEPTRDELEENEDLTYEVSGVAWLQPDRVVVAVVVFQVGVDPDAVDDGDAEDAGLLAEREGHLFLSTSWVRLSVAG